MKHGNVEFDRNMKNPKGRKGMMYGGRKSAKGGGNMMMEEQRTMMKKGGSKNVNDRIMYAGGGEVLTPN